MLGRLLKASNRARCVSNRIGFRGFSGSSAVLELETINHPQKRDILVGHPPKNSTFSTAEYAGGVVLPLTSEMSVNDPTSRDLIPVFRTLEEDGTIRSGCESIVDSWEEKDLLNVYSMMHRISTMDKVFYDAQRQGRISFYMTSWGEEAAALGSISAMGATDPVFAQYREQGVLMWRGFTLDNFADQCYSNVGDPAKGRQMPVHYGRADIHVLTISSPLTTQLPQAAGCGYALRLEGKGRVPICYFGEGAASEGDFHAGLNFAATLKAPVVYFCRNNGYAISTPTRDQYAGDGIAPRGIAYGMHTIRVDGNDFFAVHHATKAARKICAEQGKPVLIEAMSYREGHHSTSDDSTRYRDPEEIDSFRTKMNPVIRLRHLLEKKGLWDKDQEEKLVKKERKAVLKALNAAEKKPKAPVDELFQDVYDTKPPHLVRQEQQLQRHLKKYPGVY